MQIRIGRRPIGRPVRGYRLRSNDFLLAQQAVNVLCAYLRTPGAPPPASAPTLVTETITSRLGRRPGESTGRDIVHEHRYQPNDGQVRSTISTPSLHTSKTAHQDNAGHTSVMTSLARSSTFPSVSFRRSSTVRHVRRGAVPRGRLVLRGAVPRLRRVRGGAVPCGDIGWIQSVVATPR